MLELGLLEKVLSMVLTLRNSSKLMLNGLHVSAIIYIHDLCMYMTLYDVCMHALHIPMM